MILLVMINESLQDNKIMKLTHQISNGYEINATETRLLYQYTAWNYHAG